VITIPFDDSNDRWIVNNVPSENGKELVNYLEVIEDKIKNILHFAAPK
jgi:hypothetical protein